MTAAPTLRIGYLHIGRERSGLRRYGSILAAEARTRPDLVVVERDAGGRDSSWRELRAAAADLRDVDVIHVQWKVADWDPRLGGMPRLELLVRTADRPLVVTMHDVFMPADGWRRRLSATALGTRRLGHAVASLVVHSEDERSRLEGLVPRERLEVVPHFVEVRGPLPDRAQSRSNLGLEGRRVVTLLGYLTRRRGHRLVIDALASLPGDVLALFVGSTIDGRDHVRAELADHAAALGVADRVRFLGYVPDDAIEAVLVATDVALCPFQSMSASGALATWISVGRPIVTSDLAPFAELGALTPGALHPFTPYDAAALAATISATLAQSSDDPDPQVRALARRLAVPRVLDRYVGLYRAAAAGRERP
jgi:glycosyltransferase involved in cell wall biosynthesis